MNTALSIASSIGWGFIMFMLSMGSLALFLVLHALWQYLRDRNEREAAEFRFKSLSKAYVPPSNYTPTSGGVSPQGPAPMPRKK